MQALGGTGRSRKRPSPAGANATEVLGEVIEEVEAHPNVDDIVWVYTDEWAEQKVTKVNAKSFRVQNLDCTISFASQEVSWAFERPVVGENR